MKWLSPLCLLLLWSALPALAQSEQTTANGWSYEVLQAGRGPMVTVDHGFLNHNQLIDGEGKVLVSTYAIGVPDYQIIAELSPPFQTACTVMQAGGKYRFHIPVEEFKSATRGGAKLQLPGKEILWEVEVLQVLPPKPDVATTVVAVYKSEGPEAAFSHFQDLRSQRSADVYFGEWEVNQLGYFFLNNGHVEQAVDIFKYNAQAHPDSFNAHDSLAEAYHQAGNKLLAAQHYRRSLQLNPKNGNAKKMLAELEN